MKKRILPLICAAVVTLACIGAAAPVQANASELPSYGWREEFSQNQGPQWFYYERAAGIDTLLAAENDPVYGFDEAGKFTSGTRFTGSDGRVGMWNGQFVSPGENTDALLLFRVPYYGKIDVNFMLRAADLGGDGQRVRVCLNGKKIFPQEDDWLVHTYRDDTVALADLAVGQNDSLEIIVNKNNSLGADDCYMNPVITYTELTKGAEVAERRAIVKKGETFPLTITKTHDDVVVTFSSSDPLVASVDGEGAISGVGCGEAEITVAVEGSDLTRTVRVAVVEEASLSHRWSEEFSREQGPIWFYEQKIGGAYRRLVRHGNPAFGGSYEDGTTGEGYMFIPPVYDNSPQNAYLGVWNGSFMHPAEESDVAICFRAPYSGILNLQTHIGKKLDGSDGQSVSVWLNGEKIYPSEGKAVNNEAFEIVINELEVMRGDNLRVVANKEGTTSADACFIDILAEYTAYYDQPSKDKVVMEEGELLLKEGEMAFLDYSVLPEFEGDCPEERFSSSDPSVLFINSVGFMKAKKKGVAVITVTLSSGVSFTRNVCVE